MIRVKFFSSFCDSANCKSVYERILSILSITKYDVDIQFTNDDNYTHAVIINTAMPNLKIPKSNVIGLAFEPPYFLGITNQFIQYAQRHIGKYYIGQRDNLPEPFIEHHGFMWYTPFPKQIANKDKLMSIIFSNKKQVVGHQYRHLLVQSILKLNLPIDIYGHGCRGISSNDPRIKGSFESIEPYDRYRFTIAIENFSLNSYISEKFINSLLYETTPLYYGANDIDKYFPDTYIRLSGKLSPDLKIIVDVLNNPDKYSKKIDRYEVLSKLNFIDHLLDIFKSN